MDGERTGRLKGARSALLHSSERPRDHLAGGFVFFAAVRRAAGARRGAGVFFAAAFGSLAS
nr:hypothetical protein [Streptomyces tsukubensis NRRL18488]